MGGWRGGCGRVAAAEFGLAAKALEFTGGVWAGAVVLPCLPAGGGSLKAEGRERRL